MGKTGLDESDRIKLLGATRSMAQALVEDLADIRAVIEEPFPPAGYARRMSGILRRLTVADHELRKVAIPRIGRIKLRIPDVKPVIRANKASPLLFWAMGKAEFFGLEIAHMAINSGPKERADTMSLDLDATADVNYEGFLSQPCVCFQGTWITRAHILTFAANVGHAIHSLDAHGKKDWALLQQIRYIITVHHDGEMPVILVNPESVGRGAPSWIGQYSVIDVPMIETLAAAHYLSV